MTPGLALFYGGLDRGRNLANMMMNFWCLLVVPVLWVVLGFSLAQVPFDAGWISSPGHEFLRGLGVTGADGGFSLMVVCVPRHACGHHPRTHLWRGGGTHALPGVDGASLLVEQLLANGAVAVYSFVVTGLIVLALKATIGVAPTGRAPSGVRGGSACCGRVGHD